MSHDELTEEDLAAGLRALADSAEHTAMETRAIGQRLGILPPDENPRPQTVGAALAAFDGSQRALRAALGELSDARDEATALVARIAALEAQVGAAQRDNTRLIARIVELEHERDSARRGEVGAVHGRAEFRNAYRKAQGERDTARKWAARWKAKATKERRKAGNWQDSWLRAVGMAARLEYERDRAMLVVAQAVSILSRAEGLAAQLHGPVSGYITEAQVRALATALAPYREGAGE